MNNRPDSVESHLDILTAFEPTDYPVISLYLNLQPDQTGRDNFHPFVRKELRARAKTFAARSPERESFERDMERIQLYIDNEIAPESNGAAIFACSGKEDFFDALQLSAPIEENSLFVGRQPHLYPLAAIGEKFRRYACLIADTNYARIYVFGVGKRLGRDEVAGEKTKRIQAGGWSQARFQRHVDHRRLQHVKETVDALADVVRTERIDQVFLAGDEVVLPKIREQLTAELKELVADELKLDINTPETQILEATLELTRSQEGFEEDRKVRELLDQYRAGWLGVVGARETLLALSAGQVNELIISTDPETVLDDLQPDEASLLASGTPATDSTSTESPSRKIAEALVLRARQTGADVTFVENSGLLAEIGGVGALLRFRINRKRPRVEQ